MKFAGLNKKFFSASAVLVGSTVGVGIFGLPYAFARAGFWPGMILLVIIAAVTFLTEIMFGEVILRTHMKHQLLGYTRQYLGPIFQKLMFFSTVLMGYVALLAYIIVAGDFLNTVLSSFFYISTATYSVVFTVVISLVVLRGLKIISGLELIFSTLFMAVVAALFFTGFKGIDPGNFAGLSKADLIMPYGVLFFALSGLIGVPLQREVLQGQERKLPAAILLAMVFIAALYALFTTIVVGISGAATSQDAISGLYQFIGPRVTIFAAVFGIFAISSAFLTLGLALVNTFRLDFKVHRFNSWLLVMVPPLVLFLAGIRTFVDIIALAGGVAIALEQVIIVFLYAKAKSQGDRVPEYSLSVPIWLLHLIIGAFSAGILYFLFIR